MGKSWNSSTYAADMSHDPIKGTDGTNRIYIRCLSDSVSNYAYSPINGIHSQTQNYNDYGYSNFVVGSGTTPVSEDDYCLESEITTLKAVAVTTSRDYVNATVTFTKTMTNTASDPIVVSEIGIVFLCQYSTSSGGGSGTAFPVLAYREVLDTPVTVGAGETFAVTITHQLPISE